MQESIRIVYSTTINNKTIKNHCIPHNLFALHLDSKEFEAITTSRSATGHCYHVLYRHSSKQQFFYQRQRWHCLQKKSSHQGVKNSKAHHIVSTHLKHSGVPHYLKDEVKQQKATKKAEHRKATKAKKGDQRKYATKKDKDVRTARVSVIKDTGFFPLPSSHLKKYLGSSKRIQLMSPQWILIRLTKGADRGGR